ncbi:metal-dependent hydrolase [Solimonas sp. K1W22B-7]|uniref:metal-dependent hydrolase n=1 Tax=Solimonas sp. K1W22B-7 TaxID=2303331 RepID=UPI000E32F00D|nr:metal-dependent hydrolase [Solimonas sp. K1W22B-7]AXQ30531.1 metal-dependent hydrolase [Solimonas sp. K1W22B-7]
MKPVSEHPMDAFPVRPLQFQVEKIRSRDLVWSRTCPEFSMFINALGIHVPYFERYLVRALTKARTQIKDERLLRDISAIIGQEAHHAKNFIHLNQVLALRYPRVAQMEAAARDYFAEHAKKDSLRQLVGYTAGYETFTFLAGMIILQNYDRWFADSEPVIKAMWVWHQVEEVEHGAVAFEVYKHLYGDDELYRKRMVLKALAHIAGETIKAYTHMARVEGWLRNPFRGAVRLGFCGLMLLRLLKSALPVFRKDYHPRRHPLVTTQQNPIQIAWRRYESRGGDVLEIDRAKMARIMGVEPA